MKNHHSVLNSPNSSVFCHELSKLYLAASRSGAIQHDNITNDFLNWDAYAISNGMFSICEAYSYPRLTRLSDFMHTIGCPELGSLIARVRDIFYKGRTDLLTIADAWAAGYKFDHLTHEDFLEASALEDAIMGEDGLGVQSQEKFTAYIKAHPELIQDVLEATSDD